MSGDAIISTLICSVIVGGPLGFIAVKAMDLMRDRNAAELKRREEHERRYVPVDHGGEE